MVSFSLLSIEKDKFSSVKDRDFTIKLLVRDVDPLFLNTLRRVIIEEIPTLAVEDVYIYENTSALWDDFLAHRLGLIPLNTPKDLKSDEKVKLYLEARGKGWVLSKQITSKNKKVFPVYDDIPIAWLEENQAIKIEMEAVLGKGKEHAKWKPAHVFYYRLADLKLNGELSEKEKEMLRRLGVEIKGEEIKIPENKKYDRTFVDAVQSVAPERIEIIPKEEYIFVVESFGQYDVKDLIPLALDTLKKELTKILTKLTEI